MTADITILLPPKIYLDTNHLINIARLRSGAGVPERQREAYECVDQILRTGSVGIIFSNVAPLEWLDGGATLESAQEIAAVVDSVKTHYFFEGDEFLYTSEILAECKRLRTDLQVPDLPTIQYAPSTGTVKSALGMLTNLVPGYLTKDDLLPQYEGIQKLSVEIPAFSAHQYLDHAIRFRKENPDSVRERIIGYGDALLRDIKESKPGFKLKRLDRVTWMMRFLRMDRVLSAIHQGIDVEDVLGAIDLERCPAVNLWFMAREKRIKKAHDPDDNEVDDWMSLAVVPYADLVLTDRGFTASVLEADSTLSSSVFWDPVQAVAKMQEWGF